MLRNASGDRTDGTSLAIIECLYVAPGQQTGQESLAASSTRQDWATTGAGTVGTSRSLSRAR